MVMSWGKKMAVKKEDDEEMSMEEILASIRKYVSSESHSEGGESITLESHDPEPPFSNPAQVNYVSQDIPSSIHQEKHSDINEESILKLTNPLEDDEGEEDHRLQVFVEDTPRSLRSSVVTDSQKQLEKTGKNSESAPTLSQLSSSDDERNTSTMKMSETKQRASHQPQSRFGQPSTEEGLTSGKTVEASASSLSRLIEVTKPASVQATPSESRGASPTLDQLIHDLAKPLVKDWLDKNLSSMVETMVSKEIERITKQMNG